MTTLELFKKHRQGEVSRERFLYEVRRDNNLPWVTNTTSYDDAVKILKNKGIIRESAVVPENTLTTPEVDRVNPYFLKKGVQKELENNADLNNNSYEDALNKAAKKLAKDPHAFDDLLIHNASDIHKKDEKLQTREVKKGNYIDKDNGMKKAKGQEAFKAMSAPTKENRKGKPKGVKVMPDKGVEGSPKIIKEIASFIKKKLTENTYHDFTTHQEVQTPHGKGTIEEIDGGTLKVKCEDGKLYDVQMNVVSELMKKAQEETNEDMGTGSSLENRISALEEAQSLINQAIEQISAAVQGTSIDRNVQAYTIAHLDNWANGGNPYDMTIPKIIETLSEEGDEDLDETQALVVPSSATEDQINKLAKTNPSIKPGQQIDIIRK